MTIYIVALIQIHDREAYKDYIEFPDRDAQDAWYSSADYQALMQLRTAASVASIAVLSAPPSA